MILMMAAALAAQPAEPPEAGMPNAFAAWQQCLVESVEAAGRTSPPRTVADAAVRACRPRQEAMLAAHSAWLAGSELSAREQRQSRRSMERGVRNLRRQLVRLVRERRAG